MSSDGSMTGDSGMVRVMGMVVVSLLGIAVSIGLTANIIGTNAEDDPHDPLIRNALVQRLEPIGQVRTSAADLPATGGDAPGMVMASADAGAIKTGQELVEQGSCASCHVAGVAGAPKIGDADAWAERREQGYETLVSAVINGLNAMPARGGSTYTDEEIGRAVHWIADFPGDPPGAVADQGAVAVDAASPSDAKGAPDVGDGQNDMQADDSSAMAGGDTGDMNGDAATAGTVTTRQTPGTAPPADEAAADEALLNQVGDEVAVADGAQIAVGMPVPEGMSDGVKAAVDGVCAGCHVAGVANAPKIGDAAAWQERADKGLQTLTNSVINGIGVMPARGGSDLSDEEIPTAVQYMLSKTQP